MLRIEKARFGEIRQDKLESIQTVISKNGVIIMGGGDGNWRFGVGTY